MPPSLGSHPCDDGWWWRRPRGGCSGRPMLVVVFLLLLVLLMQVEGVGVGGSEEEWGRRRAVARVEKEWQLRVHWPVICVVCTGVRLRLLTFVV